MANDTTTLEDVATVGDEAVNAHVREVDVNTVKEDVPAQVVAKPIDASATVPVHEVSVTLDTVITDPSDPLAVQIPDAGRGFLDLPIHALDAPTPEQALADGSADEATEPVAADEPNPDAS